MTRTAPRKPPQGVDGRGRSVTVVGAGNIGSHLIPHLARMEDIVELVLIDPDTYEARNVPGQAVGLRECGKPKVRVQAKRVREVQPELAVTAVAAAVEEAPLGLLWGDLIIAAVDTNAARMFVNEVAFRLGVPWIDTAIGPSGLLARMNLYFPGAERPCMECGWSADDYAALEQAHPCAGGVSRTATAPAAATPTGGPSALGALAASLAALEARKVLAGTTDRKAAGREVLLDAMHHRHWVTGLRRNPSCRFDHRRWDVMEISGDPQTIAFDALLERADLSEAAKDSVRLRVPGHLFALELACRSCGGRRRLLRLRSRLTRRQRRCVGCGRELVAAGPQLVEEVSLESVRQARCRSLGALGLRRRDIVGVRARGETRHIQLGVPRRSGDSSKNGVFPSLLSDVDRNVATRGMRAALED